MLSSSPTRAELLHDDIRTVAWGRLGARHVMERRRERRDGKASLKADAASSRAEIGDDLTNRYCGRRKQSCRVAVDVPVVRYGDQSEEVASEIHPDAPWFNEEGSFPR